MVEKGEKSQNNKVVRCTCENLKFLTPKIGEKGKNGGKGSKNKVV